MQAIHIPAFVTSLNSLAVSSVPLPTVNATTLLIRVTHVSPTHVDILYAQGKHQNNRRHAKPPFILGMDFAGVVVRAPAGFEYQQGDNVYGSYFGAFAEFIALDVSNGPGGVRRVPKSWTNAEACAVGASGAISLGCFYRAGKIRKGDWVLVTGASGGLGVIACQIAKILGAKVVALAGDTEKAQMLKSIGVDACVSYHEPKWESTVLKITGSGVSMVYDAVGMVESSLRCCKFGGTVVIVGFAGRGGDMESLKVNRILLKGAGVVGYRFGEHGRQKPAETAKIWKDFDDMVDTGLIRPVVYNTPYQGLASISTAMNDMHNRKAWGRAVVTISQADNQARSRI
ncbi:NAD(P)-binding protein [Microthyrium microscopicum]|uniref:NAD(P)-binding protein n=1 Tax=Microthyrium microscopicum TaxID=703497 RepID=A0A6A6UK30_9PEZI|nr:NAD(P)-binding protein [Microthyrium microscopicum]